MAPKLVDAPASKASKNAMLALSKVICIVCPLDFKLILSQKNIAKARF